MRITNKSVCMNNTTTLSIGAAIGSTTTTLRRNSTHSKFMSSKDTMNTYPISISQYYYECLSRKSISSSLFSSNEAIEA